MPKRADPIGAEPQPTDATVVESRPPFAVAPDVAAAALVDDDTAVDAPPIRAHGDSQRTVEAAPVAARRVVPDRSEFLCIADESNTPDSSTSRNSSAKRLSVHRFLAGLHQRRLEPVVERAHSDGAEQARHHVVHDLIQGELTPEPLDNVLVSTTVERDAIRVSRAEARFSRQSEVVAGEFSSSRSEPTATASSPTAHPKRGVIFVAIGGALVLAAIVFFVSVLRRPDRTPESLVPVTAQQKTTPTVPAKVDSSPISMSASPPDVWSRPEPRAKPPEIRTAPGPAAHPTSPKPETAAPSRRPNNDYPTEL